jgi:hypothetical protein
MQQVWSTARVLIDYRVSWACAAFAKSKIKPIVLGRSALLRASQRRKDLIVSIAYPALIPQRASAPRKRDRARLFRPADA